MIAQGRAAGLDRLDKHPPDGFRQSRRPRALHRRRPAPRRQAGDVQRFASVDVADAGDHLLIEQGRLHRRVAALQAVGENRPRKRFGDGFRPQMPDQRMAWQPLPVGQHHEAEAARIRKSDDRAVADLEHDVLVRRVPGGRRGPAGGIDDDPSRHSEMGEQHGIVVELADEILRPPSQTDQRASLQAVGEIRRHRPPEIRAAHEDALDAPPFHDRRQSAANRFDFGQFRHAETVATNRRPRYLSGMDAEDYRFGFRRVGGSEHSNLVRGVFDSVARRYDLMNDLMSGGLHRLWKSALLDRAGARGRLVDVAGGTGDVAAGFIERGGIDATICDISERMLQAGLDRALDRGITEGPARVCGDASDLPFGDGCADICTIAFGLRNVTRRRAALAEMRRVLAFGGHFLCLEFSPAVLPALKPLYDAYSFRALPWLGARVAGDADAYRYLAESIRRFPDPDALTAELRAAGFGNVTQTSLTGGIVWIHSGWRV